MGPSQEMHQLGAPIGEGRRRRGHAEVRKRGTGLRENITLETHGDGHPWGWGGVVADTGIRKYGCCECSGGEEALLEPSRRGDKRKMHGIQEGSGQQFRGCIKRKAHRGRQRTFVRQWRSGERGTSTPREVETCDPGEEGVRRMRKTREEG